jgi:hypothetical protein
LQVLPARERAGGELLTRYLQVPFVISEG